MGKIEDLIAELTEYGINAGLIERADRIYTINRLCEIYGLDGFEGECEPGACRELEQILNQLCEEAYEKGIIDDDGVTSRDLFDTKLMGILTPRPSEVISIFNQKYAVSPKEATDYFYALAKNSNYIRTYRVKKDKKWIYKSEKYGEIEITINLSKPEKDPKAIEAAKSMPQSGYPKCQLCIENEGFAGNLQKPARQNIRLIPFELDGEDWRMQYSPYVYYNEHCIVLNAKHTPMKISASTFRKLLGFVDKLPHYFIGSNADLPIVGGSILSHDHMQGGRHTFAVAKAPAKRVISFKGFEEVSASILKWPMSVIRLSGCDKDRLALLADKILTVWRGYSDPASNVLAYGKLTPDTPDDIEREGVLHNTVTPIARRKGEAYELDLVLRNNIRTKEHPLGLYHPHAEVHNIKKENIGLIEVMVLAVLPARLLAEMEQMEEAILSGKEFDNIPELKKHARWFDSFKDKYVFTRENVADILKFEVGATFEKVLEHAGVYKCDEDGMKAFMRFIDHVNCV